MRLRNLIVASMSICLPSFSAAFSIAIAQTLVTTMTLGRDELALVKTSQGISTKISFPEQIKEIICGDLYDPADGRGNFVIQRSDRDLFLKPVKSSGVSNLFVKTGEEGEYTYSFELLVVPVTQSFRIVNIGNRQTTKKAVSMAYALPRAVVIADPMIGLSASPPGLSILLSGIGLATTFEPPPSPGTETPNPIARRASNPNRPAQASVTRVELQSEAIKREKPPYPYAAQQAGVSGEVVVEVVVDERGKVTESKAISGHALLRQAAVTAARSWRFRPFRPTRLDGIPVQTVGTITFVFRTTSSP